MLLIVFRAGRAALLEIPSANLNLDVLVDSVVDIESRMSYLVAECFDLGGLLQAFSDKCAVDVGRLVSRDGARFQIGKSLRDVSLNPGQKYEYISGYTWKKLSPPLSSTQSACRSVLQEYWSLVKKHEHIMRLHAKSYHCLENDLLQKTHIEKFGTGSESTVLLYYDRRRDFEYVVQEFDFSGAVLDSGRAREVKLALPSGHEEVVMHYAGRGRADVYRVRNYSVKLSPERVLGFVGRRLLERYKKEHPEVVAAARQRFWEEVGVERAEEKIAAGGCGRG